MRHRAAVKERRAREEAAPGRGKKLCELARWAAARGPGTEPPPAVESGGGCSFAAAVESGGGCSFAAGLGCCCPGCGGSAT